MSVLKVVYVAGPFRGANAWEVARNVHRAREFGMRVAQMGAMPLIPHANTSEFDGTLTGDFWVQGTLELLRRCDAVLLVEGWARSSGTLGEIEEARRLGLPVFEDPGNLAEWLDEQVRGGAA